MAENALPQEGAEEGERTKKEHGQGTHQHPRQDERPRERLDQRHPQHEGSRLQAKGGDMMKREDPQDEVGLAEFVLQTEVHQVEAGQHAEQPLRPFAGLVR